MAANVEKSPLIRFVDELDFKQIPVSVKRKEKEECPSGLILIDSNCELKRADLPTEFLSPVRSSEKQNKTVLMLSLSLFFTRDNLSITCF